MGSLALALAVAGLVGCAGMINGKTQAVNIDSNVKDAKIELVRANGAVTELGVTPYTGQLPRTKGARLVIKKEGYADKAYILEPKLSLVFFLNFFVPFGTFSSSTDISNETLWEYSPSNIYVNLERTGSSSIDFRKDSDIKRFVMMNYPQLVNDLAQSKGEHLDALVLEHFGAERADYAKITAELRRLLSESGRNVPAFGEKVAAYYFAS
jgi:hypothetical protein